MTSSTKNESGRGDVKMFPPSKAFAERAKLVLESGAAIRKDDYYEGVGLSVPGPEDEVIEPIKPQQLGLPGDGSDPFGGAEDGDGPATRPDREDRPE